MAQAHFNKAELLIIKGSYEDSLNALEKAKLLELGTTDMATCLYLECIAMRLLKKETSDCEGRFNSIIKDEFNVTWSLMK